MKVISVPNSMNAALDRIVISLRTKVSPVHEKRIRNIRGIENVTISDFTKYSINVYYSPAFTFEEMSREIKLALLAQS